MIEVSKSVLEEAHGVISNSSPSLSTNQGDLYVINESLGVVRLKTTPEDYAKFYSKVAQEMKATGFELIPVNNDTVSFLVIGKVTITDGQLFLNGRPVIIL